MKIQVESMEVSVVDHCNLRCRNCSHFSPDADESFYPIDEFERDVFALSEHYHVERIRFLGGEPLLHPDIRRFAEIAKNAGIADETVLVTNALILKSQPAETFRYFDRIHISAYKSVKIDFASTVKGLAERLRESGRKIRFEIRHGSVIHPRDMKPEERAAYESFRDRYVDIVGGPFRRIDGVKQPKTSHAAEADLLITIKFEDRFRITTPERALDSSQTLESYRNCTLTQTCQSLHRGRLYKCPRPQNMGTLAKLRGANGSMLEGNFVRDGIELHGEALGERLREYLESPRPLASCSWCLEGLRPEVYEVHEQIKHSRAGEFSPARL